MYSQAVLLKVKFSRLIIIVSAPVSPSRQYGQLLNGMSSRSLLLVQGFNLFLIPGKRQLLEDHYSSSLMVKEKDSVFFILDFFLYSYY